MAKSRGSVLYADSPKPAAETDEGKARLRSYRLALGEFVDAFAKAEIFLHFVLRWYTKTTTATARAVFSGARIDVTRGFLKRLADAGIINAEDWAELSPIIDQLRVISEKRNEILHYGAEDVAEGCAYVTNALLALTEDRTTSFPISPEILDHMTYDLRKILIHLVRRHMGRPEPRGQHDEMDAILRAAWRYKPPQQSQNRSRQVGKTPRRKRQRSPSPE
jgi:hypothetical protein